LTDFLPSRNCGISLPALPLFIHSNDFLTIIPFSFPARNEQITFLM
jgi:hypothetical protein